MSELKLIGKVKDAHGLKGELFVIFFSKDYSWAADLEKIYIDKTHQCYEVIKAGEHKDGLKVSLKGLTNRNQSEALIGKEVFVDEDMFKSEDGESIFLTEIENFNVIDSVFGPLGKITGFSSNVAQDLLIVQYKDKEIEIPFVDEFVDEIDYENKAIHMTLPEGLLEIND